MLHDEAMTDLEALVPPHEPAEDTFAYAGKAALSAIPVVGPLAAETLAFALESRQAQRQHDFNMAIAQALTGALAQLDETATLEDIVGSDEFIAAVTRAQRAAAETASEQKRHRLAAAVANGGSWAPFSASEREQFTRLVDEFDGLHVWMLHYFTNPAEWLKARGLYAQHENLLMGGISGPLESALGVSSDIAHGPVTQAAADLERNGLASIPLTTTMSADGVFSARTNAKGRRFLAFLNEPESITVDAPAHL